MSVEMIVIVLLFTFLLYFL